MAVQAGNDTAEIWTKPGGVSVTPETSISALGAIEENFVALFADGHVENIGSSIDPALFFKLLTLAGGEVISYPYE